MKGNAKSKPATFRKSVAKRVAIETSESSTLVPAKWRWHYRTLLLLRNQLTEERSERKSELSQPLEPHSMSEADSASDEFDHDLALGVLSACQDALAQVNAALARILNGTYGRCEETGKLIAPLRLRAVPWTRFSLEAEARREQEGDFRRARLAPLASARAPVNEPEALAIPDEPSDKAADEQVERVFAPAEEQRDRALRGRQNQKRLRNP